MLGQRWLHLPQKSVCVLSILASSFLAAATLLTTKSTGCEAVAHLPAANVEYHEGVDAMGYAVAPADLTPPVLSKQDFRKVPIPLNLPLKNFHAGKPDFAKTEEEWKKEQDDKKATEGKRPGIPTTNADTSESWVQPGLVTVDTETGRAEMDGKNLAAPEPAELNPDCWK